MNALSLLSPRPELDFTTLDVVLSAIQDLNLDLEEGIQKVEDTGMFYIELDKEEVGVYHVSLNSAKAVVFPIGDSFYYEL